MRNRFEPYKRMYVACTDILIILMSVMIFWRAWEMRMNPLLRVDFKGKGNVLMLMVYALLLFFMLKAFRGLKIGYYTLASTLISQCIAYVCAHLIVMVQIMLMVGQVSANRQIIAGMFCTLCLSWSVAAVITIVSTKVYNRAMPPYRMLLVYGDYPNGLKQKITKRSDKYLVAEEIYIGEPEGRIKEKMLEYGAAVLNDIPSQKKNELLKFAFEHKVRLYFVPKIPDILVKGAEEITLFDTPVFLCRNGELTFEQRLVKRAMDIALSAVGLVAVSPVMLLVAAAIKLEDGGDVIYSQERCTLHGRRFMVHKFRSMRMDAEREGGAQLAGKGDTRVTKVGAIIRKTRVDELPQLVNVLKGEMSFVGPRPERPEFVERNCETIPEFAYRMKVKAGLTGYAQVYGKYSTTFLDKLKLDLLYIERYSLLLDIQIILMTMKVVLMKESAEGLEEGEDKAVGGTGKENEDIVNWK